MASISIYGNQLLLNRIFTLNTVDFPTPTTFSIALLNAIPDRNALSTSLVEPPLTVAGSTNIASGNYYPGTSAGLPGGTFLNYFLSSPMSYSFSEGQSVTITNTATGYNTTGIVKNTVLSNTNTIAAWVSGASYAADDVVTYNGAYYVNLTGTNTTTAPFSDNVRWEFLPFCDFSQFTIYVSATVSTTFTGATGTVVANTGYSRKSISAGANWTAGQSSVYNTNPIDWTTAYLDWGSIVGWALLDDAATPNILASGELQQILLVKQNSLVSLPSGSLRLFLN